MKTSADLLRVLYERRLRRAGPGLVAGAAIFGALVGYPIWMQVAGPRHLVGSAHGSYPFAADLLGPVVPTAHQLLATGSLVAVSSRFILGDVTENGSYLGIPLLVVLVAIVAWRWRRPLVWFVALMGLVAEVLSLGPTLTVDDHPTGIPLPMKALDHLPLVTSFVDARFSLYVDPCVAALLAVGVDELWAVAVTPRRDRRAAHRRGQRLAAGPAIVLAAALASAFVPLLPAWPYPAFAADIPSASHPPPARACRDLSRCWRTGRSSPPSRPGARPPPPARRVRWAPPTNRAATAARRGGDPARSTPSSAHPHRGRPCRGAYQGHLLLGPLRPHRSAARLSRRIEALGFTVTMTEKAA